ncbi:hypothetical protein GCM10027570_21060 [Streptomonospora sediminis]
MPPEQAPREPASTAELATQPADALAAELTDLCREQAPRLFTVAEIDVENDDGWILGWGMSWPDRVVVTGADGSGFARFRSVESAMRLFGRDRGRRRSTRVVWHDGQDQGV